MRSKKLISAISKKNSSLCGYLESSHELKIELIDVKYKDIYGTAFVCT